MPDSELLYEAHSALVPWAKDDDHYALHFIIEGRNCDIFLCQGDDDELAFWQALASLWERAPLMQLRLKEARDAIAQMPPDVLAACEAAKINLEIIGRKIGRAAVIDTVSQIEAAIAKAKEN